MAISITIQYAFKLQIGIIMITIFFSYITIIISYSVIIVIDVRFLICCDFILIHFSTIVLAFIDIITFFPLYDFVIICVSIFDIIIAVYFGTIIIISVTHYQQLDYHYQNHCSHQLF